MSPSFSFKLRPLVVLSSVMIFVAGCTEKDDVVPAPDAPANLTVSRIKSEGFIVSWEKVTDAESYNLYIATDDSFTQLLPGYGPAVRTTNGDTISHLARATEYHIKVESTKAGAKSDGVTAKTMTSSEDVYVVGYETLGQNYVGKLWENGVAFDVPHSSSTSFEAIPMSVFLCIRR